MAVQRKVFRIEEGRAPARGRRRFAVGEAEGALGITSS